MNNTLKPRKLKKLSLYARSKGDPNCITWRVLGNPILTVQLEPDLVRFDWEHDITAISRMGIEILERTDTQSAVIVELIELGGEALRDLDHFCIYRLASGGIARSYGYLDQPGVCMFKIRFDSVSHNFLLYSLPNIVYNHS